MFLLFFDFLEKGRRIERTASALREAEELAYIGSAFSG